MGSIFASIFEKRLKNDTLLLERYRIKDFIGKGSYGLAYLAVDLVTNNTVIVKQARKRWRKNTEGMLENEARQLQNVSHPSIPTCIQFFEENHRFFLVMEYIDGRNFEDLILNDGQTYDEKESLQIFYHVIQVVRYLHSRKIIHRDLRLPNILCKNDQVFVIDFGLAVTIQKEEKAECVTEKQMFREQSYRSDFYALGHFLLFLLYSTFEPTSKKERGWEEELVLTEGTRRILKKLLRIDGSYKHIDEIVDDLMKHRDGSSASVK